MMPRYIFVNGEIYESESYKSIPDLFLSPDFRIIDSIWFCNGRIPLFDQHLMSIQNQTAGLSLKFPEVLNDRNELKRKLLRLINRNRAFHSGVLSIHLIWLGNEVETIVSLRGFEPDFFEVKKEGLLVGYSDNIKFSGNSFNPFEFYCRMFWEATQQNKFKSRTDGCIILNERQEVVEFTGSNLFFINDEKLFTPSPDTGCWLPPLREKILEAAASLGFKTHETRGLNKTNLPGMEEAFAASESNGIQKITGIGAKRFTHVKTARLTSRLNQMLLDN